MDLANQLDLVEKRLDQIAIPYQNREELRVLALYLKQQARSDLDRRAKPSEIQAAAIRFTKALYQVSLQASLQQPQKFWDTLERFTQSKLEVTIRPRTSAPVGSETWDAKELFEHLISQCEKIPMSPDRTKCVQSLVDLLAETRKVHYQQQTQSNRTLWLKHVYPYLQHHNLLAPFRSNPTLKGRLQFFLTGRF